MLGDRSADEPSLTDREAGEMAELGFRFSEFRPETGLYRLALSDRTYNRFLPVARNAAPDVCVALR